MDIARIVLPAYSSAYPLPPPAPRLGPVSGRERIRLAYLSGDFCEHAVSLLIVQLFEIHDRSHFEVVGISFGPDDGSERRQRIWEDALRVYPGWSQYEDRASNRRIAVFVLEPV